MTSSLLAMGSQKTLQWKESGNLEQMCSPRAHPGADSRPLWSGRGLFHSSTWQPHAHHTWAMYLKSNPSSSLWPASPPSLCSGHRSVFLLFSHSRQVSAPGPLHLPFSLPGVPGPQMVLRLVAPAPLLVQLRGPLLSIPIHFPSQHLSTAKLT